MSSSRNNKEPTRTCTTRQITPNRRLTASPEPRRQLNKNKIASAKTLASPKNNEKP